MYRYPFVLTCLLFSSAAAIAQTNKEGVYLLFNAKWESTTNVKKAAYLCRLKRVNAVSWQFDTYNVNGPLMKTGTFKDKDCTIPHGNFIGYDGNGLADSICLFADGKREGTWQYLNDRGKVIRKKVFENDQLLREIDVLMEDSIKKASGDTIHYQDEKESAFQGGSKGWQNYLMKNLRYPERALGMRKEGEIRICFVVDAKGNVEEPWIFKSVEFSLDEEAMRMITQSPQWEPAFQNGRNVKSYKLQPIGFRLK